MFKAILSPYFEFYCIPTTVVLPTIKELKIGVVYGVKSLCFLTSLNRSLATCRCSSVILDLILNTPQTAVKSLGSKENIISPSAFVTLEISTLSSSKALRRLLILPVELLIQTIW